MTKLGKLLKTIIAHADQLKSAKTEVYHMNYQIITHIIKVLLWENQTGGLNHWIQELTSFLTPLANIKVKTKSGKLSRSDYKNNLFKPKCEDFAEFDDMVWFTCENMVQSHQYSYPEKEIDTRELWQIFLTFEDKCLDLLSSSGKVFDRDFEKILRGLIK